jgi:hypothetical protein
MWVAENGEYPPKRRHTFTPTKIVGAGYGRRSCEACGHSFVSPPREWSRDMPPVRPWVITRPGSSLHCGACDFQVTVGAMAMPDWVDAGAPWR